MSKDEREKINLSELSERELLILLHDKAKRLDEKVEKIDERQQRVAMKVNTLETKAKVWGSVSGFFTAVATLLIERNLK